jgi:hypothetical protein
MHEFLFDNRVRVDARYWRSYFVKDSCTQTLDQQKAIALAIFQETQEGFERKLQGNWWYREAALWGVPGLDDAVSSSFSEEDLPSDWIAFYMAVKGYDRGKIEDLCGAVSVDESRAVYKRLYGKNGNLGNDIIGRNREWKPVNHNWAAPSCCDSGEMYLEWPDGPDGSLNDITPLPKGTCWRDWTRWDDWLFNWDLSYEECIRNQAEWLDLIRVKVFIGNEWYP